MLSLGFSSYSYLQLVMCMSMLLASFYDQAGSPSVFSSVIFVCGILSNIRRGCIYGSRMCEVDTLLVIRIWLCGRRRRIIWVRSQCHISNKNDADYQHGHNAIENELILKAGWFDHVDQSIRLDHVSLHAEQILKRLVLKFVSLLAEVEFDVTSHIFALSAHLLGFFKFVSLVKEDSLMLRA